MIRGSFTVLLHCHAHSPHSPHRHYHLLMERILYFSFNLYFAQVKCENHWSVTKLKKVILKNNIPFIFSVEFIEKNWSFDLKKSSRFQINKSKCEYATRNYGSNTGARGVRNYGSNTGARGVRNYDSNTGIREDVISLLLAYSHSP